MILEPPPPIYDFPYTGPVIENRLTSGEVAKICGGRHVLACSWPPYFPGAVCSKFMPVIGRGGVTPETFAKLKREEDAHCNGWKHETDNANLRLLFTSGF